jgi:hypothetical protein
MQRLDVGGGESEMTLPPPRRPTGETTMQTRDGLAIGTTASIEVSGCDDAFAVTLERVLDEGHDVHTYRRRQPDRANPSSEILNFQITLANPRDRVPLNPVRAFNPVGGVARFVWMMAASNRVTDMAFYEPKVQSFTDDQLSVPGSNYGMRILQPRPGVNQLRGAIASLKREVGSRRSATVIWSPEDAVRQSRDIPCAFGTFYHLRDDRLLATAVMRSNNAYLLLPYNLFEFTLLSEVVASSIGADLGPYTHVAISMHVYEGQKAAARQAIVAYNAAVRECARRPMPPMPVQPAPLEQINQLARLEAALRHDYAVVPTGVLLARGNGALHAYWLALYQVLLVHALVRANRRDDAAALIEQLPPYFRDPMVRQAAMPRNGAEIA